MGSSPPLRFSPTRWNDLPPVGWLAEDVAVPVHDAALGRRERTRDNSIEAYRKWGKEEPSLSRNPCQDGTELAEYEAKEASKRGAARRM